MDSLSILFIVVLAVIFVTDAALTYRSHRRTMKRMKEITEQMQREMDGQ